MKEVFKHKGILGLVEWKTKKGVHHREDGPAYISKLGGYSAWYIDGEFHREDGPARVWEDPYTDDEYYLKGVKYSKEDYWIRRKLEKIKYL